MNSVISNSLSFKYQMFTPSASEDIGIRVFDKTLILIEGGKDKI